jgi:glutamate synthase domain-containing protein 2
MRLRNYPISAHLRFLLEQIRPEMRQYFFESEKDGMPFSRDKRAVIYQRAKMALDKRPFGTQYDVYSDGYEWLRHSIAPKPIATVPFRLEVGGPGCAKPYTASVFNISAMSFGALSPNAIRALNGGARRGGFAHDTGEGGFSPYHRENGGDIIWEIGSGYFGCRNPDGSATLQALAELTAAAGLDHPDEFRPVHFCRRVSAREVLTFADLYPTLRPGELLDGTGDPRFRDAWTMARADSFAVSI